jgi:hypothetical protein
MILDNEKSILAEVFDNDLNKLLVLADCVNATNDRASEIPMLIPTISGKTSSPLNTDANKGQESSR